jgi:general L-amino acid transport system permease protein
MSKQWSPKTSQPSPDLSTGLIGWLRINLFSSPSNTMLTILGITIIYLTIPPIIRWAILDATWRGDSRGVCDEAAAIGQTGACWSFIKVRLGVFTYGFYPEVERWRINLILLILAFNLAPILASTIFKDNIRQTLLGFVGVSIAFWAMGTTAALVMGAYFFIPLALSIISRNQAIVAPIGAAVQAIFLRIAVAVVLGFITYLATSFFINEDIAGAVGTLFALLALCLVLIRGLSTMGWRWILLFSVYPVLGFYMLVGGVLGLPQVETHFWGGLFLTLVVAGTGMATALPIGILLALGRRSELPVIKTVCIAFIEFVRGVPLVSVLFMASVMFPLFLPENVTFNKLLRALVGIAFFYAAYMAEVIRGGLQAIPKGQYEAAKALGWAYWKMMAVIIMPQTLRLVIPGLANNFLSLFKDTTLVAVIGLLDLLGIAKAAMADSEWLGFTKEAYVFAAIVFWVFCFAISRYSVHLEKKYHTSYH